MPFEEGNKLGSGRVKGSKNKATGIKEEIVMGILDGEAEHVSTMLKELREGPRRNPAEYIKQYCNLLEFVLPKKKRVEGAIDPENNVIRIGFVD